MWYMVHGDLPIHIRLHCCLTTWLHGAPAAMVITVLRHCSHPSWIIFPPASTFFTAPHYATGGSVGGGIKGVSWPLITQKQEGNQEWEAKSRKPEAAIIDKVNAHLPLQWQPGESLRKRHKKDVIISILILQVGKLKHRVVTQPGGAAARIPVYLWGAAPGLPPEPSDQSPPILVGDTTAHSVIWSKRLQRWRFSHRLFSNSRLELRTKKRITMHALLIVLSPSGTSVGVEILAATEVTKKHRWREAKDPCLKSQTYQSRIITKGPPYYQLLGDSSLPGMI
ncbi:uncharacterized protein LOC122229344 [Panthera leo]|uniref:uncharacterized protein LOC122229344 n=1 Tax=Panthera leo TaxID=9689 RepID=UPI001C6971C7|nr:uncharacterized protein LOC122229344 [Panthera leo]